MQLSPLYFRHLVSSLPYSEGDNDYLFDLEERSRFGVNPDRPIFFRWMVPSMRDEPILSLGLGTIKGMTALTTFEVECEDPAAKAYVESNLKFWTGLGLLAATDCFDYGFAGFEVLWKLNRKRQPILKSLLRRSIHDVRPQVHKGQVVGCSFRRKTKKDMYLANPRSFWAVFRPNESDLFGESIFRGAHIPFLEVRRPMGTSDMKAVWTRKYSVPGIMIEYPSGYQTDPHNPERKIPNRDIAAMIAETYRSTGIVLRETNPGGNTGTTGSGWGIMPINTNSNAQGLLEAETDLEDKMLLGIGVQPEIIRSSSTGSYNGREIPMITLLAACTMKAQAITCQFDEQCLQVLVKHLFGHTDYTITPQPLQETILGRTGGGEGEGGDAAASEDRTITPPPPTPGKNDPDSNTSPQPE